MKVVKPKELPKSTLLTTSEEFGKLIVARRTMLNLTQETAAQLCNINTQTLAKIEKGNDRAGLNNALRVARSLGIKIQFSLED